MAAIAAIDIGSGDFAWIAAGLTGLILWIPFTLLAVLIPRLRTLFLLVFLLLPISRFTGLDDVEPLWFATIIFGTFAAAFFLARLIRVPVRIQGQVSINRPVEEIATLIRYRETDAFWAGSVGRIEIHPNHPDQWRVFTAPPLSKAIPYYDAEVLEDLAHGGYRARAIPTDPSVWRGSEFQLELEPDGDRTIVRHDEVSRLDPISTVIFWFDRGGQDSMEQLRAYAEGDPDWSIRAGIGKWWPSWRPAETSSVF